MTPGLPPFAEALRLGVPLEQVPTETGFYLFLGSIAPRTHLPPRLDLMKVSRDSGQNLVAIGGGDIRAPTHFGPGFWIPIEGASEVVEQVQEYFSASFLFSSALASPRSFWVDTEAEVVQALQTPEGFEKLRRFLLQSRAATLSGFSKEHTLKNLEKWLPTLAASWNGKRAS